MPVYRKFNLVHILVQRTFAYDICILPPFTYLMQSQGVAISWRDSVDGGVKGQPTLTAEVKPTDRKQRSNDHDRTTFVNSKDFS